MAAAATRGGSFELLVGGTHLGVGLDAKGVHTVSPVQGLSDLLICRYEALKLRVQLNILTSKHVAMVLQGVNFGPKIAVLTLHRLSRETDVILLTSLAGEAVVSSTTLSLKVVQSGRHVTVTGKFTL